MSLYGTLSYDTYKDESFTAEVVQQIRESMLSLAIDESICDNLDIDIIIEAANQLKNKSEIESKMNKASKDIAAEIKKNGLTNKKSISAIMDNFWDNAAFHIDPSMYESIMEKNKSFTKAKVDKAIQLTLCILVVVTIIHIVLDMIIGIPASRVLCPIVVEPLVEENAKQIAIKANIIKEFTVVFNTLETALALAVHGPDGFLKTIFARLGTVSMHVVTTIIQYISSNTKIHKQLGIEDLKDEEKKKRISFLGHLISVLFHACWNANCVLT